MPIIRMFFLTLGLRFKLSTRSHQKLKSTTFLPEVHHTNGCSIMKIESNQNDRV